MAARGSSVRRIPGNPLGGILRDSQRASRTVTGPMSGGAATVWAALLTTNEQGRVLATFPIPFLDAPIVQLTVGPRGDGTVSPATANVAEVTATTLSLVVWNLDGSAVTSGVTVHATAYERT